MRSDTLNGYAARPRTGPDITTAAPRTALRTSPIDPDEGVLRQVENDPRPPIDGATRAFLCRSLQKDTVPFFSDLRVASRGGASEQSLRSRLAIHMIVRSPGGPRSATVFGSRTSSGLI